MKYSFGLNNLVAEADSSLAKAVPDHNTMQTALGKLTTAFKEVSVRGFIIIGYC